MRLIDGDALIEKLGIAKDCNDCKHNEEPYCRWKPDVVDICEAINDAPTIEPERKKGKWILVEESIKVAAYKCSECGRNVWNDMGYDVVKDYPFCHCGADMRGEQE